MFCAGVKAVGLGTIDLFHSVRLPEMETALLDVLRSGHIAAGPKVAEFELAFAALIRREHVVSTNHMTSAMGLALTLAGVRAGDGVAALAFNCLSSTTPIAHVGAHPVWIDIDPATMSMALADLAAKLSRSVKAVVLYHIAGYPADVAPIADLCRSRGIPLIEDCNNAIGAVLHDQPVGVLGDYAIYSLYPNRQVNGIEGGVLATPDAITAARARRLRRFGIDPNSFRDARGEINPTSDVPEIGVSAALGHLNAAVALAQIATVPERIERTRIVASRLRHGLLHARSFHLIEPRPGTTPAYWGLLGLLERRDALLAHLKTDGINPSTLHHRNDWYSGFGLPRADLPGTALVMDRLIALPCGWWLTEEQIDALISSVLAFDAT